jgi:hypothetical protein
MIMGGFHYFEGSPDKEGALFKAVHPLRYQDVISMLKDETISLPPEEEIRDRSKSHWLVKAIVLVQALWFVSQCIARGFEKLPTTELEIVTFGYMVINVGVFIAWWDKPRNVDRPIRVFQKPTEQYSADPVDCYGEVILAIMGSQDTCVELHKRTKVPMFYAGNPDGEEGIAGIIALIVSVVFGAIHCIAWSFDFGSHTEQLLWRISSIAITTVPVLLFLAFVVVFLMIPDSPQINLFRTTMLCLGFAAIALLALSYVAARLTTLVLAFMNLASLPPGVLQAVHWTTLIPHL